MVAVPGTLVGGVVAPGTLVGSGGRTRTVVGGGGCTRDPSGWWWLRFSAASFGFEFWTFICLSPYISIYCECLHAEMIQDFMQNVFWSDRDFLIIDTPPGTSDEHISVIQNLRSYSPDGAILVTTPQVGHRI